MEKCSNVKKLRTAKPQPIFTGSYKKKRMKLHFCEAIEIEIWKCQGSVEKGLGRTRRFRRISIYASEMLHKCQIFLWYAFDMHLINIRYAWHMPEL